MPYEQYSNLTNSNKFKQKNYCQYQNNKPTIKKPNIQFIFTEQIPILPQFSIKHLPIFPLQMIYIQANRFNFLNNNTMSQRKFDLSNCSNCEKKRDKYDVFITKCIKHSYKLCTLCTRTLRGKQCPECQSDRDSGQDNGNETNKVMKTNPSQNEPRLFTEITAQDYKNQELELKQMASKLDETKLENIELNKNISNLNLQLAQKDISIAQIEIEKHKSREKLKQEQTQLQQQKEKQKAQMKETHDRQIKQIKENYEKQNKLQKQTHAKNQDTLKSIAQKEKEQLKNRYQSQLTQHKSKLQQHLDNINSKEMELKSKNQALQKVRQENSELNKNINNYHTQLAQKDIVIAQMETQNHKNRQKIAAEQNNFLNQNSGEVNQLREKHQKEIKELKERFEKQITQQRETALRQKQDLKRSFQKEKEDLIKKHEAEQQLNKTRAENQIKKTTIQFQNQKMENQKLFDNQKDQINKKHQDEKEILLNKHQEIVNQIIIKSEKEKEQLKKQMAEQRQSAVAKISKEKDQSVLGLVVAQSQQQSNHQKQKKSLQHYHESEKEALQNKHQKELKVYNQKLQSINEERQILRSIAQLNTQEFQSKKAELENHIDNRDKQIQALMQQKGSLSNHIQQYSSSLDEYNQKNQQISTYVDNMNSILINHIGRLDKVYTDTSPQKIRMVNDLIKECNSLTKQTKNQQVSKIVNEKQIVVSKYVNSEIKKFDKDINEVELMDFFFVNSENGQKLKMMSQKIKLFKELKMQDVNSSIKTQYQQKLSKKLKENLLKFNQKIQRNKQLGNDFEQMKLINEYYNLKEYLNYYFPEIDRQSKNQYDLIENNIKNIFDQTGKTINSNYSPNPNQTLQVYLKRLDELKKALQIVNATKSHKKYKGQLESHLNIKTEQAKNKLLGSLGEYKTNSKTKLDALMINKNYFDCYLYQKIFKKLKSFDEILTKQQNTYNFGQNYNKILALLKIIKQQKLSQAQILITQPKINVSQFQKEYQSINFDQSIKNRYLYKLKATLQSRTGEINKINANTNINNKLLQEYKRYHSQLVQLSQIKEVNQLPQIQQQKQAFNSKLPHFINYLDGRFKELHTNSNQFKDLENTNNNIKSLVDFQKYISKNFQIQHNSFNKNIQDKRFSNISLISVDQNDPKNGAYETLLDLNNKNRTILDKLINDPNEPFKQEHFDYYNNMITYLPKMEGTKVQQKLNASILQTISQLQQKQWLDGQMNSVAEKRLGGKLNKLQNKQIAFYRDIISMRKSKIMEDRQKIVNNEKRKLKEGNFQNLQKFVKQCHKNQVNHTKYYKVYTNILQEHMNYTYQASNQSIQSKQNFLQNIYKLDTGKYSKGIKEIFKSNEYKTYFCKPTLSSIRKNITDIQSFRGQSDTNISNTIKPIINTLNMYNMYKRNSENSLMEENQRLEFQYEIDKLINEISKNYMNLCSNIDSDNIMNTNFNRKDLFLQMIKMEIYLKLIYQIKHVNPMYEHDNNLIGQHEKVCRRINIKISKVYEQARQFRFYKQELKLQYDNDQFLYHYLKKIQNFVEVFKDMEHLKSKYETYIKNNYLQSIHLHELDHKAIIDIVNMNWRKQYSTIKHQIKQLIHDPTFDIVLKYKLILRQKQIVKNENIVCFNQIIRQEYDFKKIVENELQQNHVKIEKNILYLEKQYEAFNSNLKKMDEKKKMTIDRETNKIKVKYQKLNEEVKNSFHQIENQQERLAKIQTELNTLSNQSRTEEQNLLNNQNKKVQSYRSKFNGKRSVLLNKIIDILILIKKIESNFDSDIQYVAKKIFVEIEKDLNKFDKSIKNQIINHVKNSKNSEIILRLGDLGLFKIVNEQQFQENTKAMNDINQIIAKCPQINKNEGLKRKLVQSYNDYDKELHAIQNAFSQHKSQNRILELIKDTKANAQNILPAVMIARIFAVYSIFKSIQSRQQEINYDGNPHIAQVVAILMLLDAPNKQQAKLANRLIEVKTGQGKSRVLAGLCCYLALKGYQVYCGCYSSYLSQRDEQEFHSLFVNYGVDKMISYGPFSEHCQSIFNEGNKFNFKEVTKKVLLNEKLNGAQQGYLERLRSMFKSQNKTNKILVIDEVDVFFDQNYFGKIYSPGIVLDGSQIKDLIKFVWQNHEEKGIYSLTLKSQPYKNLITLYPHLKDLITNQVQSMVFACKSYSSHPYDIRNNEIQYIDNDTVNKKLNYGYSTAFASCFQYQRGKINQQNYNKNTNISLIIGQFSYAELPRYFDHILGVSGTVQVMSDFRKKIMRDYYKITDIYALPSIYGDSLRQITGQRVCPNDQYIRTLLNSINDVRKHERPILIFFQTEEQLSQISNAPQFGHLTNCIYKITQKMPPEMRNPLINYAGTKNRITLISSAFSRGTDFTVFDKQINQKGGMHVIQTYISKNKSDYIQILGRTGRQGKKGTFEIIVKEYYLSKNHYKIQKKEQIYDQIQDIWKINDAKNGEQLEQSIKSAKQLHQKTFEIISSLNKENSALIQQVMKLNYTEVTTQTVNTVIAIDATVSMGAALNAVLNILKDTILRTEEIITLKRPNSSFEHKIMVYRNYNTPIEKILQQSKFSKDYAYLQQFMATIKPEGGLGNEAFEVMFHQIGKVSEIDKVDQIIVIGDAPANNINEVTKYRKKFYGGEDYWNQKLPLFDSIEKYSQVITQKNIPIHSFYILRKKAEKQHIQWDMKVEKYFKNLSQSTGGLCQELNIRQRQQTLDQLTNFISERVLFLIGGKDLVAAYGQMYKKRYI